MKKLLTIAAFALFTMTSCSGDDDSNNSNSNAVLVTKTVETDAFGDDYVSDYFYEGTKVTKITHNDGSKQVFTYDGDKLTAIKHYVDADLEQEDKFTYNNAGQLATFVSLDYDFEDAEKAVFTYNTDGTVSVSAFSGNLTSQTDLEYTGTMTIQNGNITSLSSEGLTATYTYDNKKNPFVNVTSYSTLIYAYFEGGVNNILSSTFFGETTTYTYQYNSAGYPVTATEEFDGDEYTTTFTYNQ